MGRIPDSIRHKFQRIIEESKGDHRFKQMLAQGKDDNFKWAYEFAYERGYGKAPQFTEIELSDGTKRRNAEEVERAYRHAEELAKRAGLDISE